MVVLKHVLLITLATLAVATPAANQWGNSDSSGAAVAPQGRPSGGTGDGGGGSGEHGGWSKDGNDPSDDDKHNWPSGKDGGGDTHNHKERRNWSKPNGAPDGIPAGARHYGRPGGDASGSQDHGHWLQSGNGQSGNGQSGNGQSGNGQSGNGQSGNGQSGNGESPGIGGDGGSNTQTQHQSRDEPKDRGFGNGKWNGPKKEKTPDNGGDHEHPKRDALEARNPSPGLDLPDDDSGLVQLRKDYFGGANDHDDQHDGARNGTEPGKEGKHLSRRADVKGIYECSNKNFVAPCKWTQLTSDTQCYNAMYGQGGSMGPDQGLCCTVYERRSCNDKGFEKVYGFVYPGIGDYGHSQFLLNEGLGDEGIPSVMCKVSATCPKPHSSEGGF